MFDELLGGNMEKLIFRAKNWPRLIRRVGLLTRKYGKWFLPISEYLVDVRPETTIFGYSESLPKPDRIVGLLESRLTEVYCTIVLIQILEKSTINTVF